VLDSYFNFTNKSNLINSLKYDLIRFFDHLGVAYFLGHLVEGMQTRYNIINKFKYKQQ